MALRAVFSGKRRMNVILEELGVLGSMWIMAAPAVDHRRIDVKMGGGKGLILLVVAFSAQRLDGLEQQGGLGRGMGLMAAQTVFLRRRMDLLLGHLFLQLFMAGQTEVRSLSQDQFGQFGLVGVVALGALVGNHRSMFAFSLLHGGHQLFMARGTQCPLVFRGHAGEIAAMGIMAGHTLAIAKRDMDVLLSGPFDQFVMTLRTQFLAGFLEQLFLVRAVSIMAGIACPVTYRRMGVGFDELHFLLGMAGVTDHVQPVVEHLGKIGTVGIMTGGACLLGKSYMHIFGLFCGSGLGVALEAKLLVLLKEQPLVGCGMGGMAGKASLLACHWFMADSHRFLLFAMTGKAYLVALLRHQFRTFRGVRVVA